MMKEDVIEIEVLADGTIKTTTDPISPANHSSAEEFLKMMREVTGGTVTKHRRGKKHEHTHVHRHEEH